MRFRNSLSYVQRQIDKLLRTLRDFARTYVDDIVIFFKTLEEHLKHLRKMFDLFKKKRISLSSIKSFLDYSFIQLLDQRVDNLRLITLEKKIATIASLLFSRSLNDLDHFLELTRWLRHCINRYAQKISSLQTRKTTLTRTLSNTLDDKEKTLESLRKRQSIRMILDNFTNVEICAFRTLQRELDSLVSLVHFNLDRRLYVDLNAFKQ